MSPAARPFTPTREDPAALDARTVGRAALLDRLVARIAAAAATGNLNHTLLVGPRGAGKTHALAVALHRARMLPESPALALVAVPEDNVGIVDYTGLLRFVASALGVAAPRPQAVDVGAVEAAIGGHLAGRTLVLAVENLDRLFRKLGRGGQQDLRAWVETARCVLVVASTPLLFDAVKNRSEPWFGSFAVEHLDELTKEEGSALLTLLRPGDAALAGFVATPTGQARLEALHQLTGGSPRLWTILADVVSVELLDELVPAVERLLEELVGYYQQRLWDLGPNEERIVEALATGPASRTATELAVQLGIDQKVVGTTLGNLETGRWVRGAKVVGTDQRSTWYQLREPLLRHHFQYRTGGTGLLALIVEMLRQWYDPSEREHHLTWAGPGTEAERYLGASLADRPSGYDHGYTTQRPEDLLLQARRWINDPGSADGFAAAGLVIERVLNDLGLGAGQRDLAPDLAAVALAATSGPDSEAAGPDRARVGAALDRAAAAATGRVGRVLTWCAASWQIPEDRAGAEARLAALAPALADPDDLLALAVRHELAYLLAERDPKRARQELEVVLEARLRLQGDRHPDALTARSNLAGCTASAGDPAGALAQYREVQADAQAVLGPRHPHTVSIRHEVAYCTGATGDPAGALELFREVLADQEAVLGPRHPYTISTRHYVAYYTGATGDPAGALAQFATLEADMEGATGAPDTLRQFARRMLAHYATVVLRTGRTGGVPAEQREGLVGDLLDAAEGSALALARLPAELRPMVRPADPPEPEPAPGAGRPRRGRQPK
ncbi:MAG: tetratricopeptide repeat protein [Acidimicrobiales bacterium]